jgi:hypothetical protein
MTCADYQEKASTLLDGDELTIAEQSDLDVHLGSCSACELDHSLDLATRNVLRLRFPFVETPLTVRDSIRRFIAQQIAL